ncbi:uncharacterized protein [Arachis hypogaea]|uniref:uncharacterized protein n=1 Tax=Arachis hypogaea TaxID=3818 RepID=UPI003B2289ED
MGSHGGSDGEGCGTAVQESYMATRGRGRARSRESRNEQPADNHAEFMMAMRLGQPAGNGNGNRNGNGNVNGEGNAHANVEGNGDNMGGIPMTLATFLKVHSPTFRGSTNPTEADHWFQAMERALQAQHVPYNQYVEFATYQLAGEAQPWWQVECCMLQLQNAEVLWDVFRTAFYKKYFPESAREVKEMELMQLKQGSMSVAEYTNKFEELCRFSRVCQGDPETFESWRCIKYQRSLKDSIMTAVAPMEIRVFSDLVNKARVMEEYAKTVAASKDTHGEGSSKGRGKYHHPRGQSFKRGGYAHQGQRGFRNNTHDQFQHPKGRGSQSGCFNCGLLGHIARDCTHGKNPNAGQGQHQGRVFAVNAKDASKVDPLMRGICLFSDKTLITLYDTGASHSFISFSKFEELGLKMSKLPFDLHVHTPHQIVMTRSSCREVGFKLEGRDFKELNMRQRRWMELLKDYDFDLSFHPGKANVVADTLSRKSLTIAWMRIKEEELVDKFVDLNLDLGGVTGRACLNQLQILSTFKEEIQRGQQDEQKLQQLFQPVGEKRLGEFTKDDDGLWRYKGRICIPDVGSLRQNLLSEAHNSGFSIHPGSTKMYYDLKKMFWWPGMKGDVATVVSKCLTCQKVKIEHQKPSGMLQPLEIPQWKWEGIAMDFKTGLPRKRSGFDAIWVIVDHLTKSAHFLSIRVNCSMEELARLYIKEIVRLHGVPSSIVSDRDP